MPKKTPKEILQEELPDLEVVKRVSTGRNKVPSDVKPGPSISDLRRKYLGADAEADSASARDTQDQDDDVEVLKVRPKKRSADPVDDPGPKTVIFSKTKGILGAQG